MRYETEYNNIKNKYEKIIIDGVSKYGYNLDAVAEYCNIKRKTLNGYLKILGIENRKCPICKISMRRIMDTSRRLYCPECAIEVLNGKMYEVTHDGRLVKI